MLCHWLGWISTAVCVLLLLKYIGRISKNKTVNQMLRDIHRPLGLAVIGTSALHGISAFLKHPSALPQNGTGAVLFLLIVFLAWTFYAKKMLKAKWFSLHRIAAVACIVVLIVHVAVSFRGSLLALPFCGAGMKGPFRRHGA